MKTWRLDYPLRLMCRVFEVSPSGFYAWLKRPPFRHAHDEARLEVEIRAVHQRTRETYGPERLQQDLAAHGVQVGVHRIKRIRKQLGLRCRQKRKFKATTDSRHGLLVADNLLQQGFTMAQAPNQVWLSDLTYISTQEGWLYRVGHKDLFTGEIVGYALGERMATTLVSQSLWRAVPAERPGPGLVHHSDSKNLRARCSWAA
jgi:putative transposase